MHFALDARQSLPTAQSTRYSRSLLLASVLFFSAIPFAEAGQGFTQGISIIDAPSPGSPGHAGSTLPIAVEVSGNGAVGQMSDTELELLEIYLVSSETNTNITVAQGTGFLDNESGSVRHLNWIVPTCTPPGDYNLTFYETSKIDGDSYFIITPVALPIENPSVSGSCTNGTNELQAQPQTSSPPADPPFSDGSSSTGQAPTMITVTLSASGGLPFDFGTVTQTESVTRVIVMETLSEATTTETASGSTVTSTFIETYVMTTTNKAGEAMSTDLSGFVPITADTDGALNRAYSSISSMLMVSFSLILLARCI